MAQPEQKVSILLDGGVSERALDELKSPNVQQGASIPLVRSENTRLNVIRGTPVRPPAITPLDSGDGTLGADVPCRGLLPAQAGQTTAALFAHRYASRTIYGADDWAVTQATESASAISQNAYAPMHLTQAGAIPGRAARSRIATTVDYAGRVWYAYTADDDGIYVYVVEIDGAVVAPPRRITTIANVELWVGLTDHGENGVVLWYIDTTLDRVTLTLTGHAITAGSPVSVYAPSVTSHSLDVCRYDDTRAVIFGTGPSLNEALARWHNVLTGAETLLSFAGEAAGDARYCCYTDTVAGNVVTVIAVSSSSTTDTVVRLLDDTFTASWTETIVGSNGDLAAKYHYLASVPADSFAATDPYVVLAIADDSGNFDTGADSISTTFWSLDLATGASTALDTLYWTVLCDHGAQLRVSDDEMYPLFFTGHAYQGQTAAGPDSVNYVDDPCVTGWIVRVGDVTPLDIASPVARFGSLRFIASPARVANNVRLCTGSAVYGGTRVFSSYRRSKATREAVPAEGYYGRYVVLDFDDRPMRVAHDKDGTVMAAASLPVQWDGVELVEIGGPIHRPHLKIALSGGDGDNLPAGIYRAQAYPVWVDASGLTHRSRPSNLVTFTLDGSTAPIAYVTTVDSLRSGKTQARMDMQLYMSVAGGTTEHLVPYGPTAVTGSVATFAIVDDLSEENPQIYSTGDGGEIVPQPPPPLWDIAVIGLRAWGIDAEYRSRAPYSKIRIAGVGYEFAPTLEVNFPSGSGNLQRVVEINGMPIFLAEHGVYQVAGDGPSNNGGGSTFAPPVKVSDYGCDNANSVQTFPGGVVWEDAGIWHVMTGAGITQVQDVKAEFAPIASVLLADQDEVAFLARDVSDPESAAEGQAKVYNYDLQRWTTWTGQCVPPASHAVRMPWDRRRALLYSPAVGGIYTLYTEATADTALNMELETDWLLPGGDFQDYLVLQSLVFRAERAGIHTLRIQIFTNYGTTATTDITVSQADIASMLDASGRYSVKIAAPLVQDTRAVKLIITDDISGQGGAGMRPIALTLVWARGDSLLHEDSFAGPAIQ